ncbi:MAG: hypothetical protein WBC18_24340 [Ottowia sp.]|uniref:hypothetical protein n=1 Tax=Ottowia sp. TaxID=1898956 RepID=UPI003C76D395
MLLGGCIQIFSEDDCSDELVESKVSDDGQFIANVVRRDCGATTAPANIVYLKGRLESKEEDGPWGEKVYVLQGSESIPIHWEGQVVTLDVPAVGEKVFLAKKEWRGGLIRYD